MPSWLPPSSCTSPRQSCLETCPRSRKHLKVARHNLPTRQIRACAVHAGGELRFPVLARAAKHPAPNPAPPRMLACVELEAAATCHSFVRHTHTGKLFMPEGSSGASTRIRGPSSTSMSRQLEAGHSPRHLTSTPAVHCLALYGYQHAVMDVKRTRPRMNGHQRSHAPDAIARCLFGGDACPRTPCTGAPPWQP